MEGSRTNLRAGDIFALGATIYELALGSTLPNGGEDWQRIRDGDLTMFRCVLPRACDELVMSANGLRLTRARVSTVSTRTRSSTSSRA